MPPIYSILQESNHDRFAIIRGEVAPAGYPVGYEGQDWDYANPILRNLLIADAREVVATLNNGTPISAYTEQTRDRYYGCPEHAEFGDAWFYQDCPGAW